MKRWGCLWVGWLLLWLLPPAGLSPDEGGLPQIKGNISGIIHGLLSCYEESRERRFLEMAVAFSEIRTHPIFDLSWGKHRWHSAAERRLLRESTVYRGRFHEESCPSVVDGQALLRLAREYMLAADRDLVPVRMRTPRALFHWDLDQIQKRLAARQVLLKYVLLEERALLFFIAADSAGYEFLSVGREQAASMVERLSAPLEDFALGRVDYLRIHFDMELAQRLFNILLQRTTQRFPHADEFFIIPDGELFKLPFEALVTGFNDSIQEDGVLFSEYRAAEYVARKYTVSYFFSGADFLRDFPSRESYPLTLAAFGQPLVDPAATAPVSCKGSGGNAIAAIPSTRREVRSLEKMFAGHKRRIFLGADFNRENFRRYAPMARLVHVASHFFNNGDDPSRSAFLFSARGSDLSLCDARQILEFRLRAQLLILSACETSEKNLMGFKLLSGMTAAVRRSGVRDLIASLWPVDELSSRIVPLFYDEFLRGKDSAGALRRARLRLFDLTIPIGEGVRLSLAHPFLWANYVLYRFYR
ncbi:MAG: CHAT domain-containing protein [Candidatus Aminicenantes bacterium]|nr:CHAT domain-containing protein [Candidatus Aminicenantes bacterium]